MAGSNMIASLSYNLNQRDYVCKPYIYYLLYIYLLVDNALAFSTSLTAKTILGMHLYLSLIHI